MPDQDAVPDPAPQLATAPAPRRHALVAAVHILLVRPDGAVLLARRHNTGYADGQWSLPAGHIEAGEPATVAAVRETWEEVGVVIDPADLRMVHVMHRRDANGEYVNFFLLAWSWAGEPTIREPDKCDRLAWAGFGALPDNTVPYVAYALAAANTDDDQSYSEYGWDGETE